MGDGDGSDGGGRTQQQRDPSASRQSTGGGANNDDGVRPSQQRDSINQDSDESRR
jgi:hypothetical protein